MNTFRFLDFPVYTEAKSFYRKIFVLSDKVVRQYAIKDQITRAALSVILNIAEGSAKKSDKEFARFLETSIASMNEVVACLDVMKDVDLLGEVDYSVLVQDAEGIVKQLGGFIKKLYMN